jgi:hypothetical protein
MLIASELPLNISSSESPAILFQRANSVIARQLSL